MIINIIKKFPSNKAPGLDKITNTKLKNLPIKIIIQIYYIYKACLKLAYYPMDWKIAKVILVPKPDKPATSISLLNNLGKILEKIIHLHFLTHVKSSNIIIPQQFGFRQNHSCIQQLQ